MESALLLFLFSLFTFGVFGDDVKVSVKVGDSVTLHTDTEIQTEDVVQWMFGNKLIAMINDGSPEITASDQKLKDRLQLDKQTGDLKISNIQSTDSGDYTLEISRTGTRETTVIFNVIGDTVTEVKSVSVLEGDSVTLRSGVHDTQKYDVIRWWFEHQKPPVAEISRKTGIFNTSDGADGRFRDRLQLEYWTGSLTIRNIGTKHSGLYDVDISTSSKYTIHKSITVTFNMTDGVKSESVMIGASVTLQTVTEIQRDDLMQWMFRDSVIAEILKADHRFFTFAGPEERFRDRLELDETGSLTITNTRTTDSGDYQLKISSSRYIINRRISVTVTHPGLSSVAKAGIAFVLLIALAAAAGVIFYRRKVSKLKRHQKMIVSAMEGFSVTLHPENIIHYDDDIQWTFEDRVIAEKKGNDIGIYNDLDERFKEQLELDNRIGCLTIRNIKHDHAGDYKLKIRGSTFYETIRCKDRSPFYETFSVQIRDEFMVVIRGTCVTLNTGLTEIQENSHIVWMFRDHDDPIAEMKGGPGETPKYYDGPYRRFRDKLKLDKTTGDLEISKIRSEIAGNYELQIRSDEGVTSKRIWVVISEVHEDDSVSEENELLNEVPEGVNDQEGMSSL